MINHARYVCFAAIVHLFIGISASADVEIVVAPTLPPADPDAQLILYDTWGWPAGNAYFRLVTDEGLDVTAEAQWSTSDPSSAVFTAPGELLLVDDDSFVLELIAEHPSFGVVSVPFRHFRSDDEGDGGGVASTPPTDHDLAVAIIFQVYPYLESIGLGGYAMHGIAYGANGNNTNLVGRTILNTDQSALFLSPGLSMNGLTKVIYTDMATIILWNL